MERDLFTLAPSHQLRASYIFIRWVLFACLLCGFVAGSPPTATLAAPEGPGPASGFTRLTSADGLSQNSILAIYADSRGFMWFGTRNGLSRYDGYEFRSYLPDPDDPYSLSDNTITALVEDLDGALWVGTGNGGLNRLDPNSGRFTRFRHNPDDPASLGSDYIISLAVDPWGQVWIGTAGGGLARFDAQREIFLSYSNDPGLPASLSSSIVNAIYIDPQGMVWVGTEGGGLNALLPESGGNYPAPEQAEFAQYRAQPANPAGLSHNTVYTIYPDGTAGLWLGTGSGSLDHLDLLTRQVTHYPLPSSDPSIPGTNVVRAISAAPNGGLWLGTDPEGLFHFDRQAGQFLAYRYNRQDSHSPSSNHIRALLLDRRGVLWLGTDGGGLNMRVPVPEHFTYYDASANDPLGLSDAEVPAVAPGHKGGIWVGTANGGLNFVDRAAGKTVVYRHDPQDPDSLASDRIVSLYLERSDTLWIGLQDGGLDRLDLLSGRFRHYRHDPDDPASLSPGPVTAILQDSYGRLWVGTRGGGLNALDRINFTFIHYRFHPDNPGSLSSDTVRDLLEDGHGNLWVATDAGLNLFDRATGRFVRYQHNSGDLASLSDDDILTLYEDTSGRLWVGTNGSGLDRFLSGVELFEHYRLREGLPNQVVASILEDNLGRLWLGTQGGLARFDPETGVFKNYDVFDGLPWNEFNPNAASASLDGMLFYGGLTGMVAFHPGRMETDPFVPPVVLTNLTQGGAPFALERPVENLQSVTLRWPNNYFEFEYAALSYIQPEENQYAYVLEGFDAWNYVGEQRFGRYTNLPGGNYTLRIKGANHDGVWNETGLALEIRVIPPLWQQRWFLLLTGGLIGLLAVGSYRLRVQRIQNRNRELEILVRQRTIEIERRRQVAEGLREILLLLNSERSLAESVEVILRRAIQFSGAASVWLYRLGEPVPEILAAEQANDLAGPDGASQIAGVTTGRMKLTNWLAPRLQDTQPLSLGDLSALRLVGSERLEMVGDGALLAVPVWVSGEPYGGLALRYSKPRQFTPEDTELAHLLAEQAALAIGNAELRERVKEVAVAGERNRLARDLHDAVTQTLFSAGLIAEALPGLWASDPQEGQALLGELRQLSRGALAEMRTLLLELRPAAVCEAHLDDLLRQLAESASGRTGVAVEIDLDSQVRLPEEIHLGIYRIAQEALNNVVKHSRATRVRLCLRDRLREEPGWVALKVQDDGRGFDLNAIPSDHHGLKIMRERAQSIGAHLEIITSPGGGTRLCLTWPGECGPCASADPTTWL